MPSIIQVFLSGKLIFNTRFSGNWFNKDMSSVLFTKVFFTRSAQNITYIKFIKELIINVVNVFPPPGFE